jgi:hypothetical protein
MAPECGLVPELLHISSKGIATRWQAVLGRHSFTQDVKDGSRRAVFTVGDTGTKIDLSHASKKSRKRDLLKVTICNKMEVMCCSRHVTLPTSPSIHFSTKKASDCEHLHPSA